MLMSRVSFLYKFAFGKLQDEIGLHNIPEMTGPHVEEEKN